MKNNNPMPHFCTGEKLNLLYNPGKRNNCIYEVRGTVDGDNWLLLCHGEYVVHSQDWLERLWKDGYLTILKKEPLPALIEAVEALLALVRRREDDVFDGYSMSDFMPLSGALTAYKASLENDEESDNDDDLAPKNPQKNNDD